MKISKPLLTTSITILALTVGLLATSNAKEKTSQAKQHNHQQHDHNSQHRAKHSAQDATATKVSKDKLLISVKGMVCAFCAQGIEKNFNSRKEVKSTKVDLDKMEVLITFNKGKTLEEKAIEEIVTGAGFKYVGQK